MDEIKKNILALWKGLSASRKLSLVASFLLSLAVLGGVVYLASKPKLTLLYGGMQPAEAQKVVEYLDSKKIEYEVGDAGRSVLVPAAQVYSIRMGLASQGIPTLSDGGVGFELFDKPTFGMSDFMQRANYYRALQGELARTIRQLDEVANARVLIVVPEDKLFGQDHTEAKASVFVQLQPGRSLGEEQVRAIQFLVANGVEGLQPEHVAVVDSSGRTMAGSDSDTDSTGPLTDKQRQARADLESYLQEKAQSMLDRSPHRQATPGARGPGKLSPGKSAEHARPGPGPRAVGGPGGVGDRLQHGAANVGALRPEELGDHAGDEHDRDEFDERAGQRGRRGGDRQHGGRGGHVDEIR
jgi:flagellar M-ring protein FliF